MTDHLVEWMKRNQIPLDRETYIELNWPDGVPEWSAELEASLPEEIRNSAEEDEPKQAQE